MTPTPISPLLQIQLPDGSWTPAATHPRLDLATGYPTRIYRPAAPLNDFYVNGGKIGVARIEITDK